MSKTLHSELRALASVSLKAFETMKWDADYSGNSVVSNAVKLCKSYLTTPSRRQPKANLTSTAKAWKDSNIYEANPDRMQLATDVLGKQLVDTIKETQREPPDVS